MKAANGYFDKEYEVYPATRNLTEVFPEAVYYTCFGTESMVLKRSDFKAMGEISEGMRAHYYDVQGEIYSSFFTNLPIIPDSPERLGQMDIYDFIDR